MKHHGLKFAIISILFFFICSQISAKKTIKPWSLNDCVSIALQNNKDYIIAKKNVLQKKSVSSAAYAAFFPSINFTASYTMLDPKTVNDSTIPAGVINPSQPEISQAYTHNWKMGINALYPIPWIPFLSGGSWGAAYNAHEIAKKNLSLAKEQLKKVKIDTKATVTQMFYGLLINQKIHSLSLANQKRLQAYVTVARRNFNAGRISQYELLRARVQLANNTPKVLNAENNVKLSSVSLLQTLGLSLDTKFNLVGKLETALVTISEKQALSKALKNRVELKEIEHNLIILNLNKKLKRAMRRPVLAAFFNANWEYKSTGMFSSTGRSWSPSWNAGLQLSIPLSELFPWSKTKKDIKTAELDVAKMEKIKLKTIELVKLQIRQAILKLQENQKKINAQKMTITLSAEGLRIAKIRYYNGQMGNVELMDAELDYQNARVLYYQAWYNYISAKIELQKAIGIYE